MASSTSTSPTHAARTENGAAPLKQMRKGTKSCQECRRRKIKCNYPSRSNSPSDLPSTNSDGTRNGDRSATPSKSPPITTIRSSSTDTKCIECLKHNRICEVQGYTDPTPSTPNSNGVLRPKKPIYKRRREVTHAPKSPDPGRRVDDERDRPRIKVRVHRMQSMVERLVRERESLPGSAKNRPHPFSTRDVVSPSGAMPSVPTTADSIETQTSGLGTSQDRSHVNWLSDLQKPGTNGNAIPTTEPFEEITKESSPLLSQLFNNEVFTQTPYTPAILTQKFEVLDFLDGDSSSDLERLRSTISHEPYLLDILDISTHWWVAWRDQAFALHEAFSRPAKATTSPRQGQFGSSDANTWPKPGATEPASVSLRDFVRLKLSQDNVIPFATGLFCIAMSLQQLRPGVDDLDLHLSTSPATLAERIVLAIDAIVLSPGSDPACKRDPGILLLFMMRAKMYAETHQLRKSWLMVRKATETAKAIGFTDVTHLQDEGTGTSSPSEEEINLYHRQRFVGSILELDRLMSMVLGFPHAEDERFSDRLALAVLRGQVSAPGQEPGAPAPVDIKMRALRRVVAVVAGRINDRNASPGRTEMKLQTTLSIQSTLDEAAAAMPPSWWDADSHLNRADPFAAYEHLLAQMWFWQVQAFLHMPFMLTAAPRADLLMTSEGHGVPSSSGPYELNRYLCLQGCRGMLRAFCLLRSWPSLAVYICPCDDFQGVFSACILLVGLLLRQTYCLQSSIPTPAAGASLEDDLALIEEVKDIFRYRAQQQGGGISKQGVKVLEELGSFLDQDSGVAISGERTVILPYFGAIRLQINPPQPLNQTLSSTQDQESDPTQSVSPPPIPAGSLVDGATAINQPVFSEASLPEWSGLEDVTFLPTPNDPDLNWDQFLFGAELGRNWEDVDIPDWPVEEGWWG